MLDEHSPRKIEADQRRVDLLRKVDRELVEFLRKEIAREIKNKNTRRKIQKHKTRKEPVESASETAALKSYVQDFRRVAVEILGASFVDSYYEIIISELKWAFQEGFVEVC